MTESKFTAALRKELRHSIYVLKLNVAYARGVPDCYYSGSKADLWNEHKYLKVLPPTIDPLKLLSRLQAMWLEGRHAEGRDVAVIIGSEEGHVLLNGVEWKQPLTRDEFRGKMVDKKELARLLIEQLGPIKGNILP